jgi:hypothetical protein
MPTAIETPRLVGRPPRADDVAALLALGLARALGFA